jgi:hypothetical protein
MSRNCNGLSAPCAGRLVGIGVLGFAVLSLILLSPGCGGGSSSTSPGNQTTPPSNLAYPQPSITATVGTAISVDTPTVAGTAGSFTVSPALPAGLSLGASQGAISGTPTAASTMASYTVTASNSAGSTQATVQITVNPAAPSNLVYPQTSLTLEAGQSFPSDVPVVSGSSLSFSVSPALPAGLSLDAATGAVYGVPSATSGSNTYTVTASNGGGKTTATVSLTVNPALVTLLDLGSAHQINTILTDSSNLVVQDTSGHWALMDYSSGTELASGEQGTASQNTPWPVYIAGSILAVGVANGVEVRSATTGSLQIFIASPMIDQPSGTWWRLASDGSYLCAGSSAGLTAWSNSGSVLLSESGNYSAANVFAAPGQIQVGLGPAGTNVIQTILTASGSASTGHTFSGNFNTWSLDGTFFLTNLSNNIWTYSASSSQTGFLTSSPGFSSLGGEGGWIWTIANGTNGTSPAVTIYAVGSTTVAGAYPTTVDETVIPYGNTIGLLPYGAPDVTVIDLSESSPVANSTPYAVPTAYNGAYAAFSASEWITGNVHGVVFDGASLNSTARFLTQGAPFDIGGSSSIAAVALADGTIYIFDPANTTPQETIAFSSSEVQLSTDGTVLAAAADSVDAQYEPNETLNIYALPAGTITYAWPYQLGGTYLFGFSLATGGSNIGQTTGTYNGSTWQYSSEVTAITGPPTIWSEPIGGTATLSPDGTLVALSNNTRTPSAVTTIYQNGTSVTAVSGFAVGWIDDSDLLVDLYATQNGATVYTGCAIYSPTGTLVASPPLPQIMSFQTVGSGLIYTPDSNTIYSTSTGGATWTSAYPYGGVGATADGDVVFLSGARVVAQSQ